MKLLLKQYWIVIVCAIFVGGISSFGQYYSIYKLGNEYQGIPYLYQDNDEVYLSRIHEVVEGNYSVSSPYFFEYKQATAPVLPYGELLYALPIKLLNLNTVDFVHFTRFLFPAILFVLAFVLINLILKERSMITAMAGAVSVVLTPNLLTLGYLKSIFSAQDTLVLSIWTRLVNPVTGALLLFAFFIILIKIRERSMSAIIGAGLLLGFMPGYFFSFALAGLIALFVIVFLVFERDYKTAGRLFLIYPIAFIVSMGYFIRQVSAIFHGGTLAASLRTGLLVTHSPLANKVLLFGLVVLLFVSILLYLKKKNKYVEEKQSIQFLIASILAGLVAFNQQIITGKTIWPFHFVQYTKPLILIVLLYSVYLLFSRFIKLWRILMVVSIILLLSVGIKEALSYSYALENYREYQRYGIVADWLNQQESGPCVIIAQDAGGLHNNTQRITERLSILMPSVTNCDSYISSYTFFNVPEERILHNYLVYLRLNGATEKTIGEYLKNNRTQVIKVFFSDWTEIFYPGEPWLLAISDVPAIDKKVDTIIRELTDQYPDFMRKDFVSLLKQYRVDYLIYDKKYGGKLDSELFRHLYEKAILGDFVVYSFK